ncbi:MAG TPA: hypothetical protein VF498_19400 [Anaerolineales bacterium]
MQQKFNAFLDRVSEFLAQRKGLLLLLALALVAANLVVQLLPGGGFLARTNLLLHLGVITAILGVLLAWAL